MIRLLVRHVVEDAKLFEAFYDGFEEVGWQRCTEERVVLGEGGGVCLEAAMGEGDPAIGGNLGR